MKDSAYSGYSGGNIDEGEEFAEFGHLCLSCGNDDQAQFEGDKCLNCELFLEAKIQELEQIRRNLLSGTDEKSKAYREMAIEIVETCQKMLKDVLEAKFPEK